MQSRRIGEIFLEEGLIDRGKLEEALEEQDRTGRGLARTLKDLGYISESDMVRILGEHLGMPFLTQRDYPPVIPPIRPEPSKKFLKQYKVVPVGRVNGTLRLAVADPADRFPVEALKVFTGLDVEALIGCEEDILSAIEAYYGEGGLTMEKIMKGLEEKGSDAAVTASEEDDVEHLKDMARETPVMNLVNLLINKAAEKNASDIHIEPFEDKLCIRYRVDGMLHHAETLPRRLYPPIASRIKIMARLNIAERRLPQDGRIKFNTRRGDMDIRVSCVPTLHGESIVMRLLDPDGIMDFESLGLSAANRKTFEAFIKQPHGLVLVTGPTGSGKTTTLYAALSRINTSERKVITIEDPVEYRLEGVNQIQVKPKIGLGFANGLRSIVRQDPDVIMVGEIRDSETAEIAVHSALTGHLILSTLHTNDALGAVTRLLDMGVEGYLISSSLIGVMAQRLVRMICPYCKEPCSLDGAAAEGLFEEFGARHAIDSLQGVQLYRGRGCDECDRTGYRGRTGIFELTMINDDLRRLIVEKMGIDTLRQKAVDLGMVTLREDGLAKVCQGITTLEEVARATLVER